MECSCQHCTGLQDGWIGLDAWAQPLGRTAIGRDIWYELPFQEIAKTGLPVIYPRQHLDC